MSNENITFVLWSGGMDSTYLIQKLLDENPKKTVWAGYVKLLNNVQKTKMEQRAIGKMREYFEEKYEGRFEYVGVVYEVAVNKVENWTGMVQMPLWISALMSCAPKKAKEICLGYVMNDCAISYLNEIRQLLKLYNRSMCQISDHKFPKITFPLSKIAKDEICDNLCKELRQHVVWCEYPKIEYEKKPKVEKKNAIDSSSEPKIKSITPCGNCVPCGHSPLFQELAAKQSHKCEEEFVETFNPSETKLLDGLAKDDFESAMGQHFFGFYETDSEETIMKVTSCSKEKIKKAKKSFLVGRSSKRLI